MPRCPIPACARSRSGPAGLLSLLIAAAFVVSAWWFVALQVPTPYGPGTYLHNGSIAIVVDDPLIEWVYIEPDATWGLVVWNVWTAAQRHVEFPIYALFAAVATPTLPAWRFWLKPVKPGHCRCGYDLTGNVSGTCPECGLET